MPMPSAPFPLGGRGNKKPAASARRRRGGSGRALYARTGRLRQPEDHTGTGSEMPIPGAFHRNRLPVRIEQPYLLAAVNRSDRGDRQREFRGEGSNALARLGRRREQQLVLVAAGREPDRQGGIGGCKTARPGRERQGGERHPRTRPAPPA